MREELIMLTKKEHGRLSIIRPLMRREVKQKVAAELLGLTTRPVRDFVRKVEGHGARGLAHGNCGRHSPKRMGQDLVDDVRNRSYGRFFAYEGAFPAMDVLRDYIHRYGLPRSLYTVS